VVVLAPVLPMRASWQMDQGHVSDIVERTRAATHKLLAASGKGLWRRSAVHYLELGL
jgi:hypothetical protein